MSTLNRFSGAVWYNEIQKYHANIIGLGATGSWLSLFLGRAGVQRFSLIDPDVFENHNIGSQFASWEDIGDFKSDVCKKNLSKYTDSRFINSSRRRVEHELMQSYQKTIFCATLDSMEGRKYIFEKFCSYRDPSYIFFDSRISAEYWEVYCVPGNSEEKIQRYAETLFSDEEGNIGACNYQQSSHSACGAAIKIVELFTNHITNLISEEDYLPFKVSNDIRTCSYEVIY